LLASTAVAAPPTPASEPRPELVFSSTPFKTDKGIYTPGTPQAAGQGLKLEREEGPKGTLHKAQVGKVIFSTEPIMADSPETLPVKDTFTLADTIYPYTFLPRDVSNDWRSVGFDCGRNINLVFAVKIDATNEYIELTGNQSDGRQSAARPNGDKRQMTQLPVAEEGAKTPLSDAFATAVLPRLVEGPNKLTFYVTSQCDRQRTAYYMLHSQGTMTLQIDHGAREKYWAKFGPFVPASKHPMAKKLIPDLKKVVAAKWPNEEVLGGTISSADWELKRHEISGVVLSRSVNAFVVTHLKDEKNPQVCRVHDVMLEQAAQGNSGKAFGATTFGGVGSPSDLPCANAVHTK
jgi:hypothetical protein